MVPWWYPDRRVMPPGTGLSFDMEAAAIRIRCYDPTMVPALLQTDGYAEAVYAGHPDATAERVARRLTMHRRRRATAERAATRLDVVVDEAVLDRLLSSGATVATRQLAHLPAAVRQPGRTLRVVPTTTGPHGGLVAGPFTIFDFPDLVDGVPAPTIVYRPSIDGAVYLDTDETVEPYLAVWESLTAIGMNSHRNAEVLDRFAAAHTDPHPGTTAPARRGHGTGGSTPYAADSGRSHPANVRQRIAQQRRSEGLAESPADTPDS